MPTGRLALLLLPQVWVAYAYWTFHEALDALVASGPATADLGLLADAVLIVTVGIGALAVDGLVAAYLLNRVATADRPTRPRTCWFSPAAGGASRWSGRPGWGGWDRPIDPRQREDRR